MFLCLCYSHWVLGRMSDMYSLATSPVSDRPGDVNLHGNKSSYLRETRLAAGIWFFVEWCSDDKRHLVSQTLDGLMSLPHHSLTTPLSSLSCQFAEKSANSFREIFVINLSSATILLISLNPRILLSGVGGVRCQSTMHHVARCVYLCPAWHTCRVGSVIGQVLQVDFALCLIDHARVIRNFWTYHSYLSAWHVLRGSWIFVPPTTLLAEKKGA